MSLLANQRARSATEIVDASAQFFRSHAIPLLTIAAIVIIPPAVISVFVPPEMQFIIGLAENLLFSVGSAAVTVYAAAVMTEGEIGVGEAFRRVSKRLGSVIGAQILFNLSVLAGTLLLVIPGVIFATRYSLATTVAAVETTDSSQSLKRSWALTKGHAMHVFMTVLLCIGIAVLLFFGASFALGLAIGALGLGESILSLLISCLLIVLAPFVWVAMTMLYIDARVRIEGADIAAMVADLPKPSTGVPVA